MSADIPEPDWDRALCRAHPNPDLWFGILVAERQAAADLCVDCPIMADCGEYAMGRSIDYGVWGGLQEDERRALRRRRQRRRAAVRA